MLKKLLAFLCMVLCFAYVWGIGGMLTIPEATTVGYASPAKNQIEVHKDTAWFDRDNRTFGASVTINETSTFSVAYKMESNGNGDDIYQSKNNNGWVYIGTHGPGKNEYNFPSRYSIELFISVANVCAHTQGFDHMF